MRPLLVLILLVLAVSGVLFAVFQLSDGSPDDPGLGVGLATEDAGAPSGAGSRTGPVDVQAPASTRTTPEPVTPIDDGARTSGAPATEGNRVSGLVVGPQGEPVSGATIKLTKSTPEAAFFADDKRDPSTDVVFKTGSDGRYVFRDVPAWDYYGLIATHPDYSRMQIDSVQIAAQGETTGPTLRMKKGARVHGQVTDATGGPVADATLTLQTRMIYAPGDEDPDAIATTSDPSGRYEFTNVADVYGFLTVSAEGFGNATIRSVKPRGRLEQEVNVVLKTAQMIGGRVLGEGDAPVEGAAIMAMKPDGNARSSYDSVTSDAEGRFVLERVEPGPYSLAVRAQGYKHHAEQRVEAGEMNLRLRLQSEGVVSGRVLDPEGRPVASGSVRLRRVHPQSPITSPTENQTTFQDAEGRYELAGVRKGTYVVEAEGPAYAPTFSQEFTVTDGQNLPGIDVRLKRGGQIVGRVVDAEGDPVAGARVSSHDDTWTEDAFTLAMGDLFPTDATSRSTTTRGDGSFVVANLNPTTYQLRVKAPGFATHVQRGILVTEGPKDVGEILLKRGGTLTGTVLGPNGEPFPGAELQLTQSAPTPNGLPIVFKTRSGDKGVYTFTNVNAGSYRLQAIIRTDVANALTDLDPLAAQMSRTNVEIREGQTVRQDVSAGG